MVSLNSILAGIFVSSVPSLASQSQDLSQKCLNFELLEMQNLMRSVRLSGSHQFKLAAGTLGSNEV